MSHTLDVARPYFERSDGAGAKVAGRAATLAHHLRELPASAAKATAATGRGTGGLEDVGRRDLSVVEIGRALALGKGSIGSETDVPAMQHMTLPGYADLLAPGPEQAVEVFSQASRDMHEDVRM